jgi:hypothetical protein
VRLLLAAALLAACTSKRVQTPSGRQGWFIQCHTDEKCSFLAARRCPQGHRMVKDERDEPGRYRGVTIECLRDE